MAAVKKYVTKSIHGRIGQCLVLSKASTLTSVHHFKDKTSIKLRFFTYPCQKCRKVYKYRSNLLRHLRFECGVLPQFVCKLCGKYFTQKSSLKSHVAYIHGFYLSTQ
nr:unnamed protein product [Callosobruchus analis]